MCPIDSRRGDAHCYALYSDFPQPLPDADAILFKVVISWVYICIVVYTQHVHRPPLLIVAGSFSSGLWAHSPNPCNIHSFLLSESSYLP
jgi:hypothetical protein